MVRTTTLTFASLAGLALLLTVLPAWGQPGARAADDRPLSFEVRVPADAELLVDDYRVKATGEKRIFETPPLPAGKEYKYTLTAKWRGQTVSRVVRVSHDRPNKVDLTKELEAALAPPSPPPASFALTAPAGLSLRQGEEKSVTVAVERENFAGPIDLSFTAIPRGVRIRDAVVPAGKDSVTVSVAADKTATPGPSTVKVQAAGASLTKEVALELTVEKAPTPVLSLDAPSAVEVTAGGKKVIRVRAGRENFGGPVTVRFEGLPAGVTVPNVTIAADGKETTAEIAAGPDTAEGSKAVRVVGTAEQVEGTATMTVAVKRPAPPPEPKREPKLEPKVETKIEPKHEPAPESKPEPRTEAKPQPQPETKAEAKPETKVGPRPETKIEPRREPTPESKPEPRTEAKPEPKAEAGELELILPDEVVLQPGEVKFAEIRVKAKGRTSFETDPDVKLEGPADDPVKCETWSASSKSNPACYVRGYAVKAPADAPEKDREVKVLVDAGGLKAAGRLKVSVRKPQPKGEPHPGVTLEVTLPAEVVLRPGEVKYAQVRVTAKGLPSLTADPDFRLDGLADARVKCEVWSASSKADPATFTRGYAIRAAADAPAGEKEVNVQVSLEGATATGKFKITVKPAEAKP
jgi:uncharacterized protein (TIGR03000 family)